MNLYVQLNFGGNCEEAFRFYEANLGGRITMIMHQDEAPGAPPNATHDVIHARMDIAGSVLIGNDVPGTVHQPMRSAYVYYEVDTDAEAERVRSLLAEGGEVFMQVDDAFFASRFMMLRDRFGVNWSVIHPRPVPGA